jgi:tRNA pseudouridine13 synthase
MNESSASGELPRVLDALQPAPGVIKSDYDDFVVEETPSYSPGGTGTHSYFLLEKRGLSTMQAVNDLARALNVSRRDIGYAGLKDARAVTRQWMSIEHVDPERVKSLQIARLEILEVDRHTNKLRLGHLVGNRFEIKVRRTQPERLAELQDGLAVLERGGVPNYFGQQRFGGRGDAWRTGRAVVRGNLAEALDNVVGRPSHADHGNIKRARELYEAGKYAEAAQRWPGMFRDERRALKALQRTKGNKKRAFLAIDRSLRQFYVSAFQSYMFNRVVEQRIKSGLGTLWKGDLAYRHGNGAVFTVEDAEFEQPRADAFEISPSGPLYGYRMTEPHGRAAEIESRVLGDEGLEPVSFRSEKLRVKGARRPLRFQPTDTSIKLGADERGAYLELRFELPRGCYATSLLRELFSDPTVADASADD